MTDLLARGDLGFEAFGAACGLAVVAGALATAVPAFDALTVTLVALAIAAWASRHRRSGRRPPGGARRTDAYVAAFAVLAAASIAFADPPGGWASTRALALGLAVVPLWAVERRHPGAGPAGVPS